MKLKNFIALVLLSTFFITFSITYRVEAETRIEEKTVVAVINPSVGSLQGLQFLIDKKLLNIPSLQIIAICYQKAENDWEAVKHYIENNETNIFSFEKINGMISENSLFRINELSDSFKHIFIKTNGIIFLGGADFPPAIYGQKTSLLTNIQTPFRHYFELSFLFHLLGGDQDTAQTPLLETNPNYTVIGFCLGMQSMNVATGGSMYQDIPSDIYKLRYVEDVLDLDINQRHKNYWQNIYPDNQMIWANFHQIKSKTNISIFDQSLWDYYPTPFVYSSHHQAINKLGLNFNIVATSIDGKVIEIISHNKWKNVFGVQFHPEVPLLYMENGYKYKWHPNDTTPVSYYQFLKENNSSVFHHKFWQKVSEILKK